MHGSSPAPTKRCAVPGGQWTKSHACSCRSSSSTISVHVPARTTKFSCAVSLWYIEAAPRAEAAGEAEVTITMLANPQALREVTAEIEPRTLIEMSTVGPAAIHELAEHVPRLLDAPVLGSRSEAEEGTLHVFVGGPRELYDQQESPLSAVRKADPLGPLVRGAGAEVLPQRPPLLDRRVLSQAGRRTP